MQHLMADGYQLRTQRELALEPYILTGQLRWG
jgi:hypothetical protein